MSFSKYPDYKHSGVEWLGCLPNHWEVAPVARHYFLRNGYPFNAERFSPDGVKGDRLIRIRDILGNQSHLYTDEACPDNAIVENGDVLVGMDGDFNVVVWNEGNAKLNQRVCAIRGRTEPWDGFFYYAINAPLKVINDLTFSTTVKHLSSTQVMKLRFPVPPTQELEQIVTFLDHETAKIDTLIHEQQRLIELLQEKRQAVIFHAVTKGLDPSVPMKGSGVEWLGKVPAHWEVTSINKITEKITNGYVGPTRDILVKEGVPYVQATHIKNGKVNFNNAYFVTREWSNKMAKSILAEGDVLIVQTGAGTGDVGVVSANENGYNCHALIILRTDKSILLGSYLGLLLQSQYGQSVLFSIRTGGMHPHLNCGQVKFVKVPVPPQKEQRAISKHIESISRKTKELVHEAKTAVGLLQERRSALISAAVTGKIDVRNWQPPADESAFDEEVRQAGMEATV